jgi:hypothetical protein
MTTPPLRVRAAIPHFFAETAGGSGYGSGRSGQRLARCIALARCLSSLLALRRSPTDAVLHIGDRCIDTWPAESSRLQRTAAMELELHVFSDGVHQLDDVLDVFSGRIQVHALELDNPRLLPIHCRNWLLQQPPADLNLYLEDDLVISDPLFLDKQLWFLQRTQHAAVLMPHRVEPSTSGPQAQLLVDGPLAPAFIQRFCTPTTNAAQGRFDPGGPLIQFDLASNPHSGCFVVSAPQLQRLSQLELPSDGFVSPLETAATLTVLAHFPVFKPAAGQQRFLQIEHGHPSFLGFLKSLPHR